MVGDKELEGVDYLTLDEEGRVADLTVFMRPMSALTAFNEQMAERLGVESPAPRLPRPRPSRIARPPGECPSG